MLVIDSDKSTIPANIIAGNPTAKIFNAGAVRVITPKPIFIKSNDAISGNPINIAPKNIIALHSMVSFNNPCRSSAELIGKSSSYVSNILRLLELDKKIQQMVINGELSMGHARALIGVPDAVDKANEIIEKKLSVRQVEKITSEFKKNKTKKTLKDPNITDLEKELSDKIGLKTSIQFNENGSSGSLTLYYSDLNQLDDLMKRLKK